MMLAIELSEIKEAIAKLSPEDRRALTKSLTRKHIQLTREEKRIANGATMGATSAGQFRDASDGIGKISADSRTRSEKTVTKLAPVSQSSTTLQNTGEELREPAVTANPDSTEDQPAAARTFRIPAASSERFPTS